MGAPRNAGDSGAATVLGRLATAQSSKALLNQPAAEVSPYGLVGHPKVLQEGQATDELGV